MLVRLMSKLAQLEGSKGAITLGKKQLQQLGKKEGVELFTETGTLRGLKNPQLEIAYKCSDRGYNVGVFTLRDGKEVIGNGAVSISGKAETPVIKTRFNLKDGAVEYSGFHDLSKPIDFNDIAVNTSRKNGVLETSSHMGQYSGAHLKVDEKEVVETVGKIIDNPNKARTYYDLANLKIADWSKNLQKRILDMINGKTKEKLMLKEFPQADKFAKVIDKKDFPQADKFTKVIDKKDLKKHIKEKYIKIKDILGIAKANNDFEKAINEFYKNKKS